MDKFIKDKVRVTCANLEQMCEEVVYEVSSLKYKESGYKKSGEFLVADNTWKTLQRGERLKGKDLHFWLYAHITTPAVNDNEQLAMELITGKDGDWDGLNPQCLVYINGKVVQGLDINHRKVLLEPEKNYDIMIYFYVGMISIPIEVIMNVIKIDKLVRNIFYDLKVPYDALDCFDEQDYIYVKTLKCLEQACNCIDFRSGKNGDFYKSIENAEKYLKEEYYGKEWGNTDAVVSYIGHTHIDVAWLWTLAQTREKVQRTFSTVLSLMEQYPEYVFMSSQPQLYEYLKYEAPDIYEGVKKRIKEGRWEAEGAMWLEADCNISSGESLVRQILYGKRFMNDEFGVDNKILWLPDVFGYSAAMPQIMRKSGIDKFVTSKISWSESNILPYDSFMWEGIDGTEIFTYFITAQNHGISELPDFQTTYTGTVSPRMHLGTWERYQQKDYNNETIVTFGFGDGGGGPTYEMLETHRRLEKGIPGLPAAKMTRAGDFLERVEENFNKNCELTKRTPKWVGELYLELHRGTYTSMAKNKKFNRECEFLCQEAETLSVWDTVKCGGEFDRKTLQESWKTILLNQFHDIIPGSSIKEVYDESEEQYKKIYDSVGKIKKEKLENIANNIDEQGIMVYNPNGFETSGYVLYNDDLLYAENVPAMGFRVIARQELEPVSLKDKVIESKYYRIEFDDNMNIISIYDNENDREIIEKGKHGNQLCIFEDYPRDYDNWEITNYYKQKMWFVDNVESVQSVRGNGFGGFKIVRKYMKSVIEQTILVYTESRRIDFITNVDWHENHVLLKTSFATTIHTNMASYDIQFGSIERPNHQNTSWDAAKFEVCAHKWADLSEEGYGVSLLNNCKYGHSAMGGELQLTLIKCGTYPNYEADQGVHKFTYSLYPHSDSFKHGGTINEAYKLNRPMSAVATPGGGKLPSCGSIISTDCENIIVETVKPAEDGNGVIIRFFDAWNKKSKPIMNLGFDAKNIWLCDLMENKQERIGRGNSFTTDVKNFEIITVLAEV